MSLLSHLLVNDFGVPRDVMERGVKDTVIYGGSLVTNMLEMQLVAEDTLLAALGKRFAVPTFDLRQMSSPIPTIVPPALMLRHNVLPLRVQGKTLDLGMIDPRDRVAIAEVANATGYLLKPYVVLESRLEAIMTAQAALAKLSHPTKRARIRRVFGTFEETKEAFDIANHRSDVGDALLSFSLRYFARVIVFVHRRDLLMSWRHGERPLKSEGVDRIMSPPALDSLHVPLNTPSVFKTVVDTGAPFIGPLQQNKMHDFFHAAVGGQASVSFVAPVVVFGRVVNVLYGDAGGFLPGQAQRANLMLALDAAGGAYERMVRDRLAK